MKNIFVLPKKTAERDSDDLSPFVASNNPLDLVNVYIVIDYKINQGDWFLNTLNNKLYKCDDIVCEKNANLSKWCEKIILTTDTKLISDGVQEVSVEFLEWFKNNPNAESIIVSLCLSNNGRISLGYRVSIPKETGFKVENGKRTETFFKEQPLTPKEAFKKEIPKRIRDDISVKSRINHITDKEELKIIDFIIDYSFKDDQEVYTNGTILVPLYRVLDAIIQKGNLYNQR